MANCSMPKNYASWILSISSAWIRLVLHIMVSFKSVLFDIQGTLHMYLMMEGSLVHSLLQVRPKSDAHYLLSCSKRL